MARVPIRPDTERSREPTADIIDEMISGRIRHLSIRKNKSPVRKEIKRIHHYFFEESLAAHFIEIKSVCSVPRNVKNAQCFLGGVQPVVLSAQKGKFQRQRFLVSLANSNAI